jgi:hypothetical protein
MMVVKFTFYLSIIHQILSSSHFSLSELNLYRKTDDRKSKNIFYMIIPIKLRAS